MKETQAAAGVLHMVLLPSDGTAAECGEHSDGQYDTPALDGGLQNTQAAAGVLHRVLLPSDGTAGECGVNSDGQYDIPALDGGMKDMQADAGGLHIVRLRSDGTAVANPDGQCNDELKAASSLFFRFLRTTACGTINFANYKRVTTDASTLTQKRVRKRAGDGDGETC